MGMKRTPMKRRPKRISADERKYAAWIRKQRCTTCGDRYMVEFAHTGGMRAGAGMGLKSAWKWCIPLCADCHRLAPGAYHKSPEDKWADYWGIDLPAVRADLWERYKVETGVNLVDG